MGKSSTASLASAFKLLLPSPMNPITFSKQPHFVTNVLSSLPSVSWFFVCEWCIYNICYSILLHPVPSLWGEKNYIIIHTDLEQHRFQFERSAVSWLTKPMWWRNHKGLAAAWLIEPKNQWQNRGFSRSSCSQNASARRRISICPAFSVVHPFQIEIS